MALRIQYSPQVRGLHHPRVRRERRDHIRLPRGLHQDRVGHLRPGLALEHDARNHHRLQRLLDHFLLPVLTQRRRAGGSNCSISNDGFVTHPLAGIMAYRLTELPSSTYKD